jgi:acetyl esterase
MHVPTWVERGGLTAAMSLPLPAQRVLAGRPVRIDGLTLATDVQLMLRMQRLVGLRGAEDLPLADGRAVLRRTTRLTGGDQPVGAVRALQAAGLPARLYVPSGASGPGPLVVFFHGGGFWCGDLDTHDPGCRFLAERAGVRVLSVAYRLAPEHPFPAALDDAVAASEWTLEHAAEVGADPDRLAVGGDSAGGNLATVVAIEAARRGWPCAVQLLVYPATQSKRETRSLELFGQGFYLTRAFMDRADRFYSPEVPADEPRLSPMHADLPAGLAPALVYTAGFDPLRDEGEAYAERLRIAGVDVALTRFDDQIHGFANILAGRSSRAANARVASDLAAAMS